MAVLRVVRRRLAHYDYWSDRLKRSILLDSQADLLIYGMGERAVVEIANALNDGMAAQDITYIDGTVYKTREPDTSVPSITSRLCLLCGDPASRTGG